MSGMGSGPNNMGPNGGGRSDGQGGNANFDNTGAGDNTKDAWGNPINRKRTNSDGNSNGNSGNSDQNDGGIDDDLVNNIWEKIENKNGGGNDQGGGNGNSGGNGQNNSGPSAEERTQTYLKSIGLDGITLTEQEKEAATNGDFGPMLSRLNGVVANAHMKALSGSQTMIEAAVAKAIKDVEGKANANFAGHRNMEKMHELLPFTKDKAFAPVANTVLQKFLERTNGDTEKSIKGVQAYFEGLSSAVSGSKVNSNRNGNFNSGKEQNGKQNWIDILSPGNG